jgi:hypothetical protein
MRRYTYPNFNTNIIGTISQRCPCLHDVDNLYSITINLEIKIDKLREELQKLIFLLDRQKRIYNVSPLPDDLPADTPADYGSTVPCVDSFDGSDPEEISDFHLEMERLRNEETLGHLFGGDD